MAGRKCAAPAVARLQRESVSSRPRHGAAAQGDCLSRWRARRVARGAGKGRPGAWRRIACSCQRREVGRRAKPRRRPLEGSTHAWRSRHPKLPRNRGVRRCKPRHAHRGQRTPYLPVRHEGLRPNGPAHRVRMDPDARRNAKGHAPHRRRKDVALRPQGSFDERHQDDRTRVTRVTRVARVVVLKLHGLVRRRLQLRPQRDSYTRIAGSSRAVRKPPFPAPVSRPTVHGPAQMSFGSSGV